MQLWKMELHYVDLSFRNKLHKRYDLTKNSYFLNFAHIVVNHYQGSRLPLTYKTNREFSWMLGVLNTVC